ncbi:MAG: CotH kinase family protein [Bacteroidota bacterium]
MKFSILIIVLLASLIGCKKPETEEIKPIEITTQFFGFNSQQNPQLPQDILCEIKADTIIGITFSGVNISALKPSFSLKAKQVLVNNQVQNSGISQHDFNKIIEYKVTEADGFIKSYFVKLLTTNLPVLYISTNNVPIISKENYVNGALKVSDKDHVESPFEGDIEIRGRGNSTWNLPKKPYKIKLGKKSKLLGMNEARQWVLLANYSDKTLLRNELGFELSRKLGLAYTPASKPIEVILNGKYIGSYQLVEQIEVSKTKVDIEEQNKKVIDSENISGGYLIEADGFARTEKINFRTNFLMDISVHYPDDEDISTSQINYVKSHITDFETALFSADFANPSTGYRKYFDVDSYINFYLVNEIIGNPDLFWSQYLYKFKNNDKWYTGPIWDLDIAGSNDIRIGNTQEKLMLNVGFKPKIWINRLMQDKYFRNKIRERWNDVKGEKLNSLSFFISQQAQKIQYSQSKNFQTWPILGTIVYNNIQALGSFEAEVDFLKNYYTKRLLWLDTQFNGSQFD